MQDPRLTSVVTSLQENQTNLVLEYAELNNRKLALDEKHEDFKAQQKEAVALVITLVLELAKALRSILNIKVQK